MCSHSLKILAACLSFSSFLNSASGVITRHDRELRSYRYLTWNLDPYIKETYPDFSPVGGVYKKGSSVPPKEGLRYVDPEASAVFESVCLDPKLSGTGVIVGDGTWVLTVASCFLNAKNFGELTEYYKSPNTFAARLPDHFIDHIFKLNEGSLETSLSVKTIGIEAIYVHTSWIEYLKRVDAPARTNPFNVALVRLKEPAYTEDNKIIAAKVSPLPCESLQKGSLLYFCGCGLLRTADSSLFDSAEKLACQLEVEDPATQYVLPTGGVSVAYTLTSVFNKPVEQDWLSWIGRQFVDSVGLRDAFPKTLKGAPSTYDTGGPVFVRAPVDQSYTSSYEWQVLGLCIGGESPRIVQPGTFGEYNTYGTRSQFTLLPYLNAFLEVMSDHQ